MKPPIEALGEALVGAGRQVSLPIGQGGVNRGS